MFTKGLILATALLCPVLSGTAIAQTDDQIPLPTVKNGDEVVVMKTSMGNIVIQLFPDIAPLHAKNFSDLAKAGFYDGIRFHRCIEDFMIQGGDPNSRSLDKYETWGYGGNEKEGKRVTVNAEFTDLKHKRGIVSMARSQDPNSASSQFFIMHKDYPSLDKNYSAFGRVLSGMEVVDKIVKTGDRNQNGKVAKNAAVSIDSMAVVKWPVSK
ncbi:MAG: peptidylprolyl isomerase [Armatimonadetes bacterium]|nr:peptidylprolyl isomerase [Armatimonadota bacterium]